MGDDLVLFENPTAEGDFGWVFSYQSRTYLKSQKIDDALAGNAPFLVDRRTGESFALGTAYPIQFYVENFIAFGDPHKVSGPHVELTGWQEGARKTDAIHAVKSCSGVGLGDAKAAIGSCLDGDRITLICTSSDEATRLVGELRSLGFIAKQKGV